MGSEINMLLAKGEKAKIKAWLGSQEVSVKALKLMNDLEPMIWYRPKSNVFRGRTFREQQEVSVKTSKLMNTFEPTVLCQTKGNIFQIAYRSTPFSYYWAFALAKELTKKFVFKKVGLSSSGYCNSIEEFNADRPFSYDIEFNLRLLSQNLTLIPPVKIDRKSVENELKKLKERQSLYEISAAEWVANLCN